MRFFILTAFILPSILMAQPATSPRYRDGLMSPGITEGASALDMGEKWQLYTSRIFSPRQMVFTAVTAGIRQLENSPGKWGRGDDGYAKRFGTNLARTGIKNVFAASVNSAAHVDPRFYRAPDGTRSLGRVKHAVVQVLVAHKDGGGRTLDYGNIFGTFLAGEAGSLWQPRQSDGRFGDGLVWSGLSLAADAGRNTFREFWPDIRKKFKH